jgi:tetratricopeptide (TPR) repeat protein
MALEGPLKELHINDVFQLLDLGRKSGVLRVTSELRQTVGTVSFDRGGVVAASLGKDSQPLGTRLVRLGKIAEGDLVKARAMQESGDARRLGDILVANGALSRRELDRQLKGQIEDAIFELLGWSEGYFRFEEGAPCEAMVESPVRLPTEALLMEAARRHDEWSRIEAKVPHLRVVPRLPPPDNPASGRIDLMPFEWEVLAAVDGQRDLHALASALGRSEFDVARTVFSLSAAGVIVVDNPSLPAARGGKQGPRESGAFLGPARAALADGEYEKAAKALQDVLRADPLLPEARRLFGLCQVALGRFRAAAETWKSWARLGTLTPAEEALAPEVERLRHAAEALAHELESHRGG